MHLASDCDGKRRLLLRAAASCAIASSLAPAWLMAQDNTLGGEGPKKSVASGADSSPAGPAVPSPFEVWIHFGSDGRVAFEVCKAEMGQGVLTALPMLLAEELDIDLESVEARQAPVDPERYDHLTVGSSSIESLWRPLRVAAARAREAFLRAAAARWGLPKEACRTESGRVIAPAVGNGESAQAARSISYFELLPQAAALIDRCSMEPALKSPEQFRVVGRGRARVDSVAKCNGSAVYGIDVRAPQSLRAVMIRCPAPGTRVGDFDAADARAVRGVRAVFAVEPAGADAFTRGGVAVIAETTWAALEGRRRLRVEWDESEAVPCSTPDIRAAMRRVVAGAGPVVMQRGAPISPRVLRRLQTVEAVYELPFLAHATLEPMNATVHARADAVEAWLPTQNAAAARAAIARTLECSPSVHVHQTLLGGGFGRRDATDFVVEAAQVAARCTRPVQLLWTREDDLQFDRFRPAAVHRLAVTLDRSGFPRSWLDRLCSVSIQAFLERDTRKPFETEIGGAVDIPYRVPSFRMEYTPLACPVAVGWWRSVEDSINTFAIECFVDELAAVARIDPLQYRLRLLTPTRRIDQADGHHIDTARLSSVLAAVARAASWGLPHSRHRARGLACHSCRGSYVAVVVEAERVGKRVTVHRIWAAVDCGQVVNPVGAEAQIQGGLHFGLSAALAERITIESSRIVEGNFDRYPLLRMAQSPATHVQLLPSSATPTGIGELAVPVVAPAVANALFAATGRRIRALPIEGQLD